eukprot:TRINITY_DN2042_c0_g1_i1.p1 TRINITY_DN2042_c0_g1~~TRINITY_DN2042_c0_g1_i1.p1  ORF type:complete len:413 (+),score=38.87 TRINITY_DN2042_c0_g1_i1:50-1240(+)
MSKIPQYLYRQQYISELGLRLDTNNYSIIGIVQRMEKEFEFRGVQCSKEEANVACWGFMKAKDNIKRLYFKLPELGEKEVRIKVLFTGLCHTDYHTVQEAYGPITVYPIVPGHEVVGQIEKTGAKAKNFKVGDIVGVGPFRDNCGKCENCMKGEDQLCTENPYKETYDPYLGGFSTHLHIKEDYVFLLPKELDPSKAAPLLCAGVTTFTPLKAWGKAGMKCGVIGIGGLGHIAIQIANKMGMHVVGISRAADKEADCICFGAKEFVHSKNKEQIKAITEKPVFDIMLNTAYTHDLRPYMEAVKPGGVFIQAGIAEESEPLLINNTTMALHKITLAATLVGSKLDTIKALDFFSFHGILPKVEMYSWAEFPKAYEKMSEGKARYRGVVAVADTFDNA